MESMSHASFLLSLKIPILSKKSKPQRPHAHSHHHHHPAMTSAQIDCRMLLLSSSFQIDLHPPTFASFKVTISVNKPLFTKEFLDIFNPLFIHILNISRTADAQQPNSLALPFSFASPTRPSIFMNFPIEETQVNGFFFVQPSSSLSLTIFPYQSGNSFFGTGLLSEQKKEETVFATIMQPSSPISCILPLSPQSDMGVQSVPIGSTGLSIFYQILNKSHGILNSAPEDSVPSYLMEPQGSLFHRWIITYSDDRNGVSFTEKVLDFIDDYHLKLLGKGGSATKPRKALTKSLDVISGFHFVSPCEHVFVLESRATSPCSASDELSVFFGSAPKSLHIIGDAEITFPLPRLYIQFNSLIQKVEIPLPVREFLRIKQMYNHHSRMFALFPVAQKLNYLFSCQSILAAGHNDIFPTFSEIGMLNEKYMEMFTSPLFEEPKSRDQNDNSAERPRRRSADIDPHHVILVVSYGKRVISNPASTVRAKLVRSLFPGQDSIRVRKVERLSKDMCLQAD